MLSRTPLALLRARSLLAALPRLDGGGDRGWCIFPIHPLGFLIIIVTSMAVVKVWSASTTRPVLSRDQDLGW